MDERRSEIDSREVKERAISGVFWQGISTVIARLVYLSTTLILAGLLTPGDFGLIALAWLVINTLALFRDAGVGKALIQRRAMLDEASNTAFVLIPAVCLFLYAIAFTGAPYIGKFFDNSQAEGVIKVMTLTMVISSLGTVPSIMLERELSFKRKIIPEVSASLGYAVCSIALAFLGFGVWSIAYGEVVRSILLASLIWLVSGWRPTFKFNWALSLDMLKYGVHVIAFSIGTFVFFSVDNAVVGKVLGSTLLGYYAFAYSLSNLPATKITEVLSRVTFPAYSRLQGDKQALRDSTLRTMEYVSMVIVPAGFAIFAVGPIFLKAMYGQKWLGAIPLLQVLWFYGLLRSLLEITKSIFMATGKPNLFSRITTLQLFLILPLIYLAAKYQGTMGVAVLMTGAIFIGAFTSVAWAGKLVDIKVLDCLLTTRQSFAFSAVPALVVFSVGLYNPTPGFGFFLVCSVLFLSLYTSLWWFFGRGELLKVMGIFKKTIGSRTKSGLEGERA